MHLGRSCRLTLNWFFVSSDCTAVLAAGTICRKKSPLKKFFSLFKSLKKSYFCFLKVTKNVIFCTFRATSILLHFESHKKKFFLRRKSCKNIKFSAFRKESFLGILSHCGLARTVGAWVDSGAPSFIIPYLVGKLIPLHSTVWKKATYRLVPCIC